MGIAEDDKNKDITTSFEESITTYQPQFYHFSKKKKKNLLSLRMLMILTLIKCLQMIIIIIRFHWKLEIEGETKKKIEKNMK